MAGVRSVDCQLDRLNQLFFSKRGQTAADFKPIGTIPEKREKLKGLRSKEEEWDKEQDEVRGKKSRGELVFFYE